MIPEDPLNALSTKVLTYITGFFVSLTISLGILFTRRSWKRHDDLESRVHALEKGMVTKDDFNRIDAKLDKLNEHLLEVMKRAN